MRLFIATAEVSGDVHGARLLTELKERLGSRVTCDALGGPYLREAGARIHTDLSTASSVGLLEGLPFLFSSLGLIGKMGRHFREVAYDAVILVDGQGRNLPLMEKARRAGRPTVYYFPPPVSIWGKWNVKRMKVCDLLLTPFPDDHEIYRAGGCATVYTGHPFATLPTAGDGVSAKKAQGLAPESPVLGLFPGSRRQEVAPLCRDFLEAAKILSAKVPGLQMILSLAHPAYRQTVSSAIAQSGLVVKVVEGNPDGVLSACDGLLTASGTATLQAAFHGVPMAIAYRISALTYTIGRMLVKGNFIGLPNILAGREVAPEFINRRLTPGALAACLLPVFSVPGEGARQRLDLLSVREKVSTPDPFAIMAAAIEKLVARPNK